jgi:hypothetical protein
MHEDDCQLDFDTKARTSLETFLRTDAPAVMSSAMEVTLDPALVFRAGSLKDRKTVEATSGKLIWDKDKGLSLSPTTDLSRDWVTFGNWTPSISKDQWKAFIQQVLDQQARTIIAHPLEMALMDFQKE